MPEDNSRQAWEFERKVPLAIILAILSQFVLGIWYTAKLDSRLVVLETANSAQQLNYATLNTAREAQAIRQAQIGDNIEQVNQMMKVLLNRSNSLHPEFQRHDNTKGPPE